VLTTYIHRDLSITIQPNDEKGQTNLCRNGDAEEVNEADVLVPDDLDLINQTEPTEVVPQLFFGCVLIQTTEVHVSAGIALLNCQSDLAGNWGRFSPTDLQLLPMQRQLLNDRVGIELSGGRGVQEGQEDARLLREYSDRF